MIVWIFDNIPQEKIFITLAANTIKRTNQLGPSIAVFPTWSCEYPQRGAEMGTYTEVHNSESPTRSPTTLNLDTALYLYNFSCGLRIDNS